MDGYPWYETIKADDLPLSQGELIYDCPALYPTSDKSKGRFIIKAIEKRISGVVMTQSCDLAQGKTDTILLCAFSTIEEFEENTGASWKKIKEEMENINKGRKPRYFLLNCYDNNFDSIHEDYKIVDFQDVYTVPVRIAQEVVKKQTARLRLLPPYREKLAYAYANYFSRIGLPVDIESKDIEKRCRG